MYDISALWTLGQRVENIVHPSTQRCQFVLKQTAIMLLARTNDSVASSASPCDAARARVSDIEKLFAIRTLVPHQHVPVGCAAPALTLTTTVIMITEVTLAMGVDPPPR